MIVIVKVIMNDNDNNNSSNKNFLSTHTLYYSRLPAKK